MHQIPNFDAMETDELFAFGDKYVLADPSDAENLIGDKRDGYCEIADWIGSYAFLKARANQKRMEGLVDEALRIEKNCDRIYKSLPEDLRW